VGRGRELAVPDAPLETGLQEAGATRMARHPAPQCRSFTTPPVKILASGRRNLLHKCFTITFMTQMCRNCRCQRLMCLFVSKRCSDLRWSEADLDNRLRARVKRLCLTRVEPLWAHQLNESKWREGGAWCLRRAAPRPAMSGVNDAPPPRRYSGRPTILKLTR